MTPPREQRLFSVVPLRVSDQKKAQLLEAIVNQPRFVSKVLQATELFIERFIMPQIMLGTTFTEEQKEEGIKAIVEELQ